MTFDSLVDGIGTMEKLDSRLFGANPPQQALNLLDLWVACGGYGSVTARRSVN